MDKIYGDLGGRKVEEIIITENESGQRLDRFLRKLLKQIPLGEIYKSIRKGFVKVNGKKTKESYMLQVGDRLAIYIKDVKASKKLSTSYKKLDIVYEDKKILIVDKPIGILCHSDSKKNDDTLIHRVLGYLDKEDKIKDSLTFTPALCNRLDRNTSGLVIAAKNYNALKDANETIRKRGLIKYYLCVVKGSISDKGRIDSLLGKDESRRLAYFESKTSKDGKYSRTNFIKLADNGDYSLLKVELATGRFHQIRVHLSGIGNPIIGDAKYGDNLVNNYFYGKYGLQHQFLIALSLYFENPLKSLNYLKNKIVHSEVPDIYIRIINDLFSKLDGSLHRTI